MEWFEYFIDQNFILICTSIIVIVHSLQYLKRNRRFSIYFMILIAVTLFIALGVTMENYARHIGDCNLTLFWALVGYIFRPLDIYIFMLMAWREKKEKWFWLTLIPEILTVIIFSLAYVPGINEQIVTYKISENGAVYFGGGPLRYISHISGFIYLALLFFAAFRQMRLKHFANGLGVIFSGFFLILAVIIETFFNNSGDVFILNATIGVSILSFLLFDYIERGQYDVLTGLFNRATYYHDLPKMSQTLTGVIQLDLNGLKYFNDNYGHEAGDKALKTVASTILQVRTRRMYAYRMGGDEFIILALNCDEATIKNTVDAFIAELEKTGYHCSIGYSYRSASCITDDELIKEAETKMYEDKEIYYKNTGAERRRGIKG